MATAKAMKTPEQKNRSPKFSFQSPTIKARVQEKEELSDLNDRLASYIDCMRSLEQQNAKLSYEITSSKETRSREISNVKAMFEAELGELRRVLDDTSKEKALLQLENTKLNGIVDDLRPKLEQEQALNKRLQDKLRNIERRLSEKENLLVVISNERLDLQGRVRDLESHLKDLEAKRDVDKESLEKEIINRIDAENRYQTLLEESQFNAQVHVKEVNDLRSSVESESIKYNLDVADGAYDNVLRDKLQELREEFEEEAENAKQELEDAYKAKFDDLRAQSERDRTLVSKFIDKQNSLKVEIEKLKSDNNMLSSKSDHFQKRIHELESLRVIDKEEFRHQLEERELKIKELQEKYEDLQNEYETLLGIKIALDMELAAYNKLLQGEEERLNLATPENKRPASQRRGTKRTHEESKSSKKSTVESTSTGNVAISDVDPQGISVTVTNNGDKDEELTGCFINREVDGKDSGVGFQFPSHYVLPAQQSVTVWASSSGKTAMPPSDLVMVEDWLIGAGGVVVTTLVNPEAEITAKHTATMAERSELPRKARRRRTGADRESCALM